MGRPEKPPPVGKSAQLRLGVSMRDARKACGMSIDAVARESGFSKGYLSEVERGLVSASRGVVELYASILHGENLLELHDEMQHERARRHAARHGRGTVDALPPRFQGDPDAANATLSGDRSRFEGDVTIPDGMLMRPAELFVKVWRITNAGSVPWRGRVVRRVGALTGAGRLVSSFETAVPDADPGDSINIVVPLRAPRLDASPEARFFMHESDGRLCYPDRYAEGLVCSITVRGAAPPLDEDDAGFSWLHGRAHPLA